MKIADPTSSLQTVREKTGITTLLLTHVADAYSVTAELAKSFGVAPATLRKAMQQAYIEVGRAPEQLQEGWRKISLKEPTPLKAIIMNAAEMYKTGNIGEVEYINKIKVSDNMPVGLDWAFREWHTVAGIAAATGINYFALSASIRRRSFSVATARKIQLALNLTGVDLALEEMFFDKQAESK